MSKSIVRELIIHSFKNLFNFKGRAGRLEYFLFVVITGAIYSSICHLYLSEPKLGGLIILMVIQLGIFTRRMHDLNYSVWRYFLLILVFCVVAVTQQLLLAYELALLCLVSLIIPLGLVVYSIVLTFALFFKKGKREPNKYGDPIQEFSLSKADYLYVSLAILCHISWFVYNTYIACKSTGWF